MNQPAPVTSSPARTRTNRIANPFEFLGAPYCDDDTQIRLAYKRKLEESRRSGARPQLIQALRAAYLVICTMEKRDATCIRLLAELADQKVQRNAYSFEHRALQVLKKDIRELKRMLALTEKRAAALTHESARYAAEQKADHDRRQTQFSILARYYLAMSRR